MYNLLRKEFITLKSSLWIVFFYLAVFSLAFIPKVEMSIYFVGIYTAIASIMLITMIDIKNNNQSFLVSLPVNRRQIVQAKYTVVILFAIFGILASYAIHAVVVPAFPQLNKPDTSIVTALLSAGIVFIISSIYLPLFYALSKKGAAIINAVLLIVLIVLAQPVSYLILLINKKNLLSDPMAQYILIGILVLFIASYFLTIKLFSRRDL